MRSLSSGATRREDHAVAVEERTEHLLVRGQVLALEDDATVVDETDLGGDRPRGCGMVAGDHRHADAGSAAGFDRGRGVCPRRILEREQAEQLEVGLGGVGRRAVRYRDR